MDVLFDTMLKVSSGMLALSVTFRKSIVGDSPTAGWLLILAWVAFTLVPVFYCLIQLLQGTLFDQFHAAQLPLRPEERMGPKVIDQLGAAHGWMAVVLMACFLVGIVAFGSFAVANM